MILFTGNIQNNKLYHFLFAGKMLLYRSTRYYQIITKFMNAPISEPDRLAIGQQPLPFKKICLHCGRESHSNNYTCECGSENWRQEYRSLDLRFELDKQDARRARRSFRRYSFKSALGMLQYALLPFVPRAFKKLKQTAGLTPLYYMDHLSKYYGSHIYIKNEGDNPSGCFKDRETMLCLINSKHKQSKRAVIYSSGNAAASAALFAQRAGIQMLTFVAGDTYEEKIEYIQNRGSDVIVIGDAHTNFEEGYRLFAGLGQEGLFEQQQFDNWSIRNPYRVQGDKTTAIEIIKQISGNKEPWISPDYVVVPTANGSCLAGIWKGFKELYQLGLIDKLPAMVSVGIQFANPVFKAVLKKEVHKPMKGNIDKLEERDAQVGSTIVAEEGYDSIQAARAVLESDGYAVVVRRRHIRRAMSVFLKMEKKKAIEHAILPEPASFTALAAIRRLKKRGILKAEDKVVSVITGHGMKGADAIYELAAGRRELRRTIKEIIRKRKKRTKKDDSIKKGRCFRVNANHDAVVKAFLELSISK